MPSYPSPRPVVAVDCVIFRFDRKALQILLLRRSHAPFKDKLALPGGQVRANESCDVAATRVLEEKTGLRDVAIERLGVWDAPRRDPRGRVITLAYLALLGEAGDRLLAKIAAGKGAAEAMWIPAAQVDPYAAANVLAFDHAFILRAARTRLRARVRTEPIAFELLPTTFSLGELQALYEAILGEPVEKRNFRKRILSLGFLEAKGIRHGAGREAEVYSFDRQRYLLTAERQEFRFLSEKRRDSPARTAVDLSDT